MLFPDHIQAQMSAMAARIKAVAEARKAAVTMPKKIKTRANANRLTKQDKGSKPDESGPANEDTPDDIPVMEDGDHDAFEDDGPVFPLQRSKKRKIVPDPKICKSSSTVCFFFSAFAINFREYPVYNLQIFQPITLINQLMVDLESLLLLGEAYTPLLCYNPPCLHRFLNKCTSRT